MKGIFSSSESEVEHFECVVCNKLFKSQKQFEAHEKSKKHIKAVKQLRKELLLEGEELNLDADEELEVKLVGFNEEINPIPAEKVDDIAETEDDKETPRNQTLHHKAHPLPPLRTRMRTVSIQTVRNQGTHHYLLATSPTRTTTKTSTPNPPQRN